MELRLVATVQTRNYQGYIESQNTIYFLQAREGDRWKTLDIVKLEDLPPDEQQELNEACIRMTLSIAKKNAAK